MQIFEDEKRIARRYCAVIQLSKASDLHRIADSVPGFVAMVERWSKGEMEQLCRSNDGQLFGFVFKTDKPPRMLSSEFESSSASQHGGTFIAFEIGEHCASAGFARPLAWIQHH